MLVEGDFVGVGGFETLAAVEHAAGEAQVRCRDDLVAKLALVRFRLAVEVRIVNRGL